MPYIVLVDHRSNNDRVSTIQDEEDNIEIYNTLDEAAEVAKTQFLAKSFRTLIIDLDRKNILEAVHNAI